MTRIAITRLQEPLPRGTAMLSNIAVSTFCGISSCALRSCSPPSNTDHLSCVARCKASCSAWSSFLENRTGPSPKPEAPAQASDPEHPA